MSEADTNDSKLADAIAGVYAGPLDAFVTRRDALVKELRASGQREAATTVKNLRKPSRVAWALDLGVLGTPHALQALDAALNDTLAAHSGTGDVRAAMAGLRSAVRELAAHAARAAEREGLPVDAGTLASALLAVLGSQESLHLLRRGSLAEVPASDGLDFLATLPPAPVQVSRPHATKPKATSRVTSPSAATTDREAELEHARKAEAALLEARAHADTAQQTLRDAEARLVSTEKALREVEVKTMKMRADVERARQVAEAAAAALRNIENAALSQ